LSLPETVVVRPYVTAVGSAEIVKSPVLGTGGAASDVSGTVSTDARKTVIETATRFICKRVLPARRSA
jgi:hypothetical protein